MTERGSECESELFTQLVKRMEIDKLRTTAYPPSTNGAVERFLYDPIWHVSSRSGEAGVLRTKLYPYTLLYFTSSYAKYDVGWLKKVSVIGTTDRLHIGFSPNKLFLGREVRMPLDLVMGLPSDEFQCANINEFVQKSQEHVASAYAIAREHLGVAAQRRKTTNDIRVHQQEFTVGDWVSYWYPRRYPS